VYIHESRRQNIDDWRPESNNAQTGTPVCHLWKAKNNIVSQLTSKTKTHWEIKRGISVVSGFVECVICVRYARDVVQLTKTVVGVVGGDGEVGHIPGLEKG
jgi:hypothetical protein